MAGDSSVLLNLATVAGGQSTATYQDTSGNQHSKAVLEMQSSGDPVKINSGNPLPVTVGNGIAAAASKKQLAVTSLALVNGAACTLYSYDLYSPSTSTDADVYLQIFDAATTGAVTLGSTAPVQSVGVAGAHGGSNLAMAAGIAFASGIVVAATTTQTGSTLANKAMTVNMSFT